MLTTMLLVCIITILSFSCWLQPGPLDYGSMLLEPKIVAGITMDTQKSKVCANQLGREYL
ncbi:hypothetical protein GQ44DRAFT_705603, partial [Phaeosphaeriaceae sp. PMI808]